MKKIGYTSIKAIDREIDSRPGILIVSSSTSKLSEHFVFTYFFDNRTIVFASSYFPWDDGTSMMLETIHVEKVE